MILVIFSPRLVRSFSLLSYCEYAEYLRMTSLDLNHLMCMILAYKPFDVLRMHRTVNFPRAFCISHLPNALEMVEIVIKLENPEFHQMYLYSCYHFQASLVFEFYSIHDRAMDYHDECCFRRICCLSNIQMHRTLE